MGFKPITSYTDEKYGNWFRLPNDGDYADVIIMYRSIEDVMMVDSHYIKSDGYSGYVTCCGRGCPACAKQIRIQPKLFVPVYVVGSSINNATGKLQFWDRTMRFQTQLMNDVFRNYPNPCDFVFRITRHGVANDVNTIYDIRGISRNTDPNLSYDTICARFNAVFPDYFNTICKDVDQYELNSMMISTPSGAGGFGGGYGGGYGSANYGSNYGATPRGAGQPGGGTVIPGTQIPLSGTAAGASSGISMPTVGVNAMVPESAPDPNDLPFGGATLFAPGGMPPIESDDSENDIDMTNLKF